MSQSLGWGDPSPHPIRQQPIVTDLTVALDVARERYQRGDIDGTVIALETMDRALVLKHGKGWHRRLDAITTLGTTHIPTKEHP